jgi:mRNA interferase HigB
MVPKWERVIMHIIAKKTLREFWKKHPDSEQQLRAWHSDVKRANWQSPAEIVQIYSTARCIAGNRAIFDIKGGTYRLVVKIHYDRKFVYIRFIGTHSEYDRIDASSV